MVLKTNTISKIKDLKQKAMKNGIIGEIKIKLIFIFFNRIIPMILFPLIISTINKVK
jgi:hypothetical protein